MTSVGQILTPIRLAERSFAFPDGTDKPGPLFGGQLLGQAVVSAGETVTSDLRPRSLHGDFLRPANDTEPVRFDVDIADDQNRAALRHVRAIQGDTHVAEFTVTFAVPESGPDVPARHSAENATGWPPDDSDDDEVARQVLAWRDTVQRFLALDISFSEEPARAKVLRHGSAPADQTFHVRCRDALPNSPVVRCAAVAYMSDLLLLSTALGPRGLLMGDPSVRAVTTTHSLWFHMSDPGDGWLRYHTAELHAGAENSVCHGSLSLLTGEAIATSVQEGVIRRRHQR